MGERELFLLFTDTGTWLSRAIKIFTKKELNHVSISFSEDLKTVYSFGRKQPRNPFIGGFVLEDVKAGFLAKSQCAIYRQEISKSDYERMISIIREIEANQEMYRYNFIGLFGVLLHVQINRRSAFFCSQFVATVLKESASFSINKPVCFITPADLRCQRGLELIYKGELADYRPGAGPFVIHETAISRQSFVWHLSNKFKQFVMK